MGSGSDCACWGFCGWRICCFSDKVFPDVPINDWFGPKSCWLLLMKGALLNCIGGRSLNDGRVPNGPNCCWFCDCCWFNVEGKGLNCCWRSCSWLNDKGSGFPPAKGCWLLKDPKNCCERNGFIGGCCCGCCCWSDWNWEVPSNVLLKDRARSFGKNSPSRPSRFCCLVSSEDCNWGRWLMNGSLLLNWLLVNWLPNWDSPKPAWLLLGKRLFVKDDVPKGKRVWDPNCKPDGEEESWNWPPCKRIWLDPKEEVDPVPKPAPPNWDPPLFWPKLDCPNPNWGSLLNPDEPPNCCEKLKGLCCCPFNWFWSPSWFWSKNGFWTPIWFWIPNWLDKPSWFWRPSWFCCCNRPSPKGFWENPNWFWMPSWFWKLFPLNWFWRPSCAPTSWFCKPNELNWLPWPSSAPFCCWGSVCWKLFCGKLLCWKPFCRKLFWGKLLCWKAGCWKPFCEKLFSGKLLCWKPLCCGIPLCWKLFSCGNPFCWNPPAAPLNGNPIPDCWKGNPPNCWGVCCRKNDEGLLLLLIGRRPAWFINRPEDCELLLRCEGGPPSWSSSFRAWPWAWQKEITKRSNVVHTVMKSIQSFYLTYLNS